uniref:Glycoside hydrolase, family 79 n=1 Tax=Solibacter usitatus (strain Ellin6076) TaxID=234267 RepID=Q022K2_SOLUE
MTRTLVILLMLAATRGGAQPIVLAPRTMPRTGAVDPRFQSYNIEMVEVTGGRFWKPYASAAPASAPKPDAAPAGLPADLLEYRPPIDLANARLRKLAATLGPTYIRVSGTWANTIYFHDSDDAAPEKPPAGFNAILTRKQWKGVIDFVQAAEGRLVTSFAFGAGNRDTAGAWTPDQARHVIAYTKAAGGSIAAAEFMNEPNYAAQGGAIRGYDAAAYGRDIETFRRFFREAAPGSLFLGPGSTGEGGVLGKIPTPGKLQTEDLLKATGPVFDVFSYHIYAAVSQRCSGPMPSIGTTAAAARSSEWLSRPDKIHAFYADLRDRYLPGKPLWVTEVADAGCGGNPWASTFLDTFRYLNQHGRLAQQGVQMIAHNTLSASDYGLLDEKTYDPRPNYWGAVLWHRLMGTTVLNPVTKAADDLYLYAHCQAGHPSGVTVLAINAGTTARELDAPMGAERYTLSAAQPDSPTVQLNGRTLEASADGGLPPLTGAPVRAGRTSLPAASITFLVFPDAANQSCR